MSKITKLLFSLSVVFLAATAFFIANPQKALADTCTPNASRQCISNIVYWYNSCGVLQTVAQNCNTTNQVCQQGQCVNKTTTTTTTTSGETPHYVKSCYNNNMYWYGSKGTLEEMYQSCADTNSCTSDICNENKCQNQLKCDGSTCAVGSQDYNSYCTGAQNQTTTTTTNQTTTTGTQTQIQTGTSLAVSSFIAKGQGQWTKSITGVKGDAISFLLVIKNTSGAASDNVSITTDLTNNISYTGNLKIDGIDSAGNITTGINLGSIPAKTSKIISFSGTLQPQANQTIAQITSTITANNIAYDSDYVAVTMNGQNTANATSNSSTQTTSFFSNINKNWLIWIIIVIVLIIVFIIIFRKLSTNV